MGKAKLHEILAVESTLSKASEKLVNESKKTLAKTNLFTGSLRELRMFDRSQDHLDTDEKQELVTTVDENLTYLVEPVSVYWDAVLQKDLTNQKAVADLIVEGVTLATGLPATFLLGLETKLGEIRKLYDSIGTLQPGSKWEADADAAKKGIFKADYPVQFKTENVVDFQVVVPPTEFHKADVRELSKVTNTGKYTTTVWSGLLTPLDKAMRIKRIDTLILAVKKARQRANSVELVHANVGESLFSYING